MREIVRIDSTSPSFNDLIAERYSRRDALRGGAGTMAMAVFGSAALAACDGKNGGPGSGDPAPIVSATASSTSVTAGTLVTITGTSTDDGSITGTSFVQVSGPTVTLSATTGATTSFVVPAVASATSIAIRFAATDNSGNTTSVDVTVNVSPATLSFSAVAKNRNDVVTVPAGYTASILYGTGDPLRGDIAAYRNDGTDNSFILRIGDHGGALRWYGLSGFIENVAVTRDDSSSSRGVIVQNFENINQQYLHAGTPSTPPRNSNEVTKEIAAMGIGMVEVFRDSTTGAWRYNVASPFNRRITADTDIDLNGPARGSLYLQTPYSPTGVAGRGTVGNGAGAASPWATFLSCEENWVGYFRRPPASDDARRTAKEVTALTRYGVTRTLDNYAWSMTVPPGRPSSIYYRFDVQATDASATSDFRNEHNQFGWVVEVDPYGGGKPRKRTALGRMNHGGCSPAPFVAGVKPAFYMGDNAANEYLYKFVSAATWTAADATSADRLSIGDKYLDAGTLYVAQFKADGTGTWLPLTFGTAPLTGTNPGYPFADQADVLTHARLAGDAVGATRMDQPGWTTVNPATGEVYLTLNGNATRTPANADPANPRAYVDPPSPALGNRNGHIARLREANGSPEATSFSWDIYLFGAGSDLDPTDINVSGLTADSDFSGPEGCGFSRSTNAAGQATPLLWIQADDKAYLDVTNCMMLAGIPGAVGDGGGRTIVNRNSDSTTVSVATRVGKIPGTNLKRFLVGPIEAEITGIDTTPDGRILFVGIQHPGQGGTLANITSHWPATQATGSDATNSRPRSATIVIQRTDGGIVGL